MKRYYFIKETINDILIKNDGLEHSVNVSNMACLLAKLKNLDLELAAIIGICHDLATYKFKSSFDHANRSSMLSREILVNSKLFSHDEIILITTAIKNHSLKNRIDDKYSELIKDADLLVQYLNEPNALFSKEKQCRLDNIFKMFNK